MILTAVAVMIFAFSNAQETRFGIKGGGNLHTLTGDMVNKDNKFSKIGFQVGGFAEIKISDKFSVQPEVLFSVQGVKFKRPNSVFKTEDRWKLSYLNIPVMAKFYIAKRLSLEGGPQTGFLLGAKNKYKGVSGTMEGYRPISGKEDIKYLFDSIDFGVNFGAGYDFTDDFSVGFRYNLGLVNIANDKYDFETINSVLALNAAYKF